jgi:hypothetical protein
MPVLLALVFGLFGLLVVAALAVFGDRTMRRLMLLAAVVALALVAFMHYAATVEQPITNVSTTVAP